MVGCTKRSCASPRMSHTSAHIAVDLGAESGRVSLGTVQGERVSMHLCHRFGHSPIQGDAGLSWDLDAIWREVQSGLTLAAKLAKSLGVTPSSVGACSWGVDYAMLGPNGELHEPPRCYRDPAFASEHTRVAALLGSEEVYRQTGIQQQPFNTLYQYATRFKSHPERYSKGSRLLFVPDILHWLLSGKASNERTNASTSQMMRSGSGAPGRSISPPWNKVLLSLLGLPTEPLQEPRLPGSTLGSILPAIAEETGLSEATQVILPPTHDTAAAVAAVPAVPGSRWCYLSSGTWSLLGAELEAPYMSDAAREANFTNELGVAGTVRFLKNISGLWLVQRVRKEYAAAGEDFDYKALTKLARAAPPLRTLFPVDLAEFTTADSTRDAIVSYARRTDQVLPRSAGEFVRACLESLALQYAVTFGELATILDSQFDVIHVVGGGSHNLLLNQMTANATRTRVIAGPAEASALGNALVQAIGTGTVRDLAHLRAIVSASECPQVFEPDEEGPWQSALERYQRLLAL